MDLRWVGGCCFAAGFKTVTHRAAGCKTTPRNGGDVTSCTMMTYSPVPADQIAFFMKNFHIDVVLETKVMVSKASQKQKKMSWTKTWSSS